MTTHDRPVEAVEMLEGLTAIGAVLSATDCLSDVLLVIAQQARRALHANALTIARLDGHQRRFEPLVNLGAKASPMCFAVAEFPTPPGQGFLRSGTEGRSEAAWPVIIDEVVWGVVGATKSAGPPSLDHDDLSVLRQVASHIAAAVTRNQRITKLEELARRDPLTGLANRRVLEEKLTEVFDRNPIDRRDVALIMADVDGLKLINDRLGHGAGDELLAEAGRALSAAAATDSNSTVCRVGGDEFCVILDGGGRRYAEPLITRALQLFSESDPERSMSYGIAVATADLTAPGDLLRAADEAQYEQKRQRQQRPCPPEIPPLTTRRRRHRN